MERFSPLCNASRTVLVWLRHWRPPEEEGDEKEEACLSSRRRNTRLEFDTGREGGYLPDTLSSEEVYIR